VSRAAEATERSVVRPNVPQLWPLKTTSSTDEAVLDVVLGMRVGVQRDERPSATGASPANARSSFTRTSRAARLDTQTRGSARALR